MADALISRERYWYGDLPEVCITTGEPAVGTVSTRHGHVPLFAEEATTRRGT